VRARRSLLRWCVCWRIGVRRWQGTVCITRVVGTSRSRSSVLIDTLRLEGDRRK
jgi:hypothetical protein